MKIDIGAQFSRFPAGRTPADGKYSGQAFRERFLKENLALNNRIIIILDNAISYGSSFLEEAFGGLVRAYCMDAAQIREKVQLDTHDPFLRDEIWTYVDDAQKNATNA